MELPHVVSYRSIFSDWLNEEEWGAYFFYEAAAASLAEGRIEYNALKACLLF
jgi:hypothetical protein